MCYDDGSPGAAAYDDTVCRFVGGAIPQTYDCGHDDYFNPDAGAGQLPRHALERLHAAPSWASCAQLGMACGATSSGRLPGQHRAAGPAGAAQLGTRTRRQARAPGSTADELRAAAGSAPRPRAGSTSPVRPAGLLRAHDADVGAALRVVVTATNDDGAASPPRRATAPVAGTARRRAGTGAQARTPKQLTLQHPPARPRPPRQGTLAAQGRRRVRPGARSARTAISVAVTPGTWRLRLCAGPKQRRAALRAVQARAHAPARRPASRSRGCSSGPRTAPCASPPPLVDGASASAPRARPPAPSAARPARSSSSRISRAAVGDAPDVLVALGRRQARRARRDEQVAEALDEGQRRAQVVDERAQLVVGHGSAASAAGRRARSRRARARARWRARGCAPAACG